VNGEKVSGEIIDAGTDCYGGGLPRGGNPAVAATDEDDGIGSRPDPDRCEALQFALGVSLIGDGLVLVGGVGVVTAGIRATVFGLGARQVAATGIGDMALMLTESTEAAAAMQTRAAGTAGAVVFGGMQDDKQSIASGQGGSWMNYLPFVGSMRLYSDMKRACADGK
jgi:hypothetical protein